MDKLDLKDLKSDVRNIYLQNIVEFYLVSQYCLFAYFKSVFSFGMEHVVTKDVVNVWKEFRSILLEEKNILSYLVKNGLVEDISEIDLFLNRLDELNIETFKYYLEVLDCIETACDMETDWRAKRPRKNFKTLIETDVYRKDMCYFTLSLDDVKDFLGYEEEFWDYIENRIYLVDSHFEEDREFYGVNMKTDDQSCLVDIKVFVPFVVNMETALVNVHEFHHAYCLYKRLGFEIISDYESYEQLAKEYEDKFRGMYVLKKYKNFYGDK